MQMTAKGEKAVMPNSDAHIRRALAQAVKRSPKSRQQIADELSRALGHSVSVAALENYTSAKPNYRFPAAWVAAFCAVTGSDELLRCQAEPVGLVLISEHEAALVNALRASSMALAVMSGVAKPPAHTTLLNRSRRLA